ncbi:Hypothetical predicted protein [Lecanosticta acicola]|uniref:Uncharacterized protein n=1 Tax=Lecanosticta acicola TaxID=111012 RepID=A0AAI9EBS5_9PEZI|nr:Hypothetical predicted protein [Lecanosticta acicola]
MSQNQGGVAGQPRLDQAYETAGNPTDKAPVENTRAQINAQTNDENAVAHRDPSETVSFDQAVPTSMARGIRGAGPGEETKGYTQESLDREELDADQMGAPGEGKVASAVERHPGAGGKQPGLETDLERKKAEQAPMRQAVQEEQQRDFDVGGILGQRGGAADPVGKNNYPNTGSS